MKAGWRPGRGSTALAASLLVLAAAPLPAQGPSEAVATVEASSTMARTAAGDAAESSSPTANRHARSEQPFTAGWRDGFVLQSEDGDFRLQIGLLVQADGRFAAGDSAAAVTDTFLIRRARPSLRGRFARRFEFNITPDFGGGTAVVQDAYVDTLFSPAFRIRAGKSKTPFGLERLHAAASMLFFERALPSSLVPNRDVGVQVLGDLRGGLVSYGAAVTNGVPDGGSGDLDTGDGKDFSGRAVLRPFIGDSKSPLQGLGVAVSGSAGSQTGPGALPSFRTPSLQQPYFSYSGALADGVRTRYSPQAFYYHRTFAAFGEYVHTSTPIRRGGLLEDIAHDAWQVAASIVLTGESATDAAVGIRPRASFDPGNGHWGALQLAARYHTLAIDERAFSAGFTAPAASRRAEAWTVGLNWFLTQNVKYVVNFERTVFDDDREGTRPPENGIVFRTQVNF